jgi:hypothetical protein
VAFVLSRAASHRFLVATPFLVRIPPIPTAVSLKADCRDQFRDALSNQLNTPGELMLLQFELSGLAAFSSLIKKFLKVPFRKLQIPLRKTRLLKQSFQDADRSQDLSSVLRIWSSESVREIVWSSIAARQFFPMVEKHSLLRLDKIHDCATYLADCTEKTVRIIPGIKDPWSVIRTASLLGRYYAAGSIANLGAGLALQVRAGAAICILVGCGLGECARVPSESKKDNISQAGTRAHSGMLPILHVKSDQARNAAPIKTALIEVGGTSMIRTTANCQSADKR